MRVNYMPHNPTAVSCSQLGGGKACCPAHPSSRKGNGNARCRRRDIKIVKRMTARFFTVGFCRQPLTQPLPLLNPNYHPAAKAQNASFGQITSTKGHTARQSSSAVIQVRDLPRLDPPLASPTGGECKRSLNRAHLALRRTTDEI